MHSAFCLFIFLTALRGGISQCSLRYSKANNKYLHDFNPSLPSTFILYFDINNLYGWAMAEMLPISDYKWAKNISAAEIMETEDESDTGYMLEVDLEYPQELHDIHNDYPLCAEHMEIGDAKHKKLLLNLHDKKNYVLHYRTLKFALASGMKLKKIHKVLQFKQSKWLKPYIDLNTIERTNATNDFDQNLFKLASNAIFGKSMENVRKHVDVKLSNKWDGRFGAKNLIARPNFKHRVIFNENLVAIEMAKTNINIFKPIIVGVSILEISKINMYRFHYDFMIEKFKEKCKLCYTDTDSFIYHVESFDAYEIIKANPEKFDTSGYAPNNPYKIELCNKKVPGIMKDETNGVCITEFVGLRSKMYSIKVNNNKVIKRAKGVKNNILNKKITFEKYFECIKNHCSYYNKQCTIKSLLHNVYSVEQTKRMLDPFDDKRYVLENNIDTLAWGHYLIGEMNL